VAARRRRVVWALRARRALDEAIGYVAAEAPETAAALLARVLDAAASLAELSERGQMVPEMGDPTLRELLVRPYRLLYEVAGDQVQIVGLLHVRRDFVEWERQQGG
jgi:plasmid stabilization system protein ParE